MTDGFNRSIDYMRVSVTDRCNLRCKYCMPKDIKSIPHDEILRNEEFLRVCKTAASLGVKNIRVTGGEPLVRRGVAELIGDIKALPDAPTVSLTTNGVLLEDFLPALKNAGVARINISLDTMDKDAYKEMTGTDALDKVLSSIKAGVAAGFIIKINCVSLKGFNENEFVRLAELSREYPLDVRFIEAMPIGLGRGFSAVAGADILAALKTRYPDLSKADEPRGFGPAVYYESKSLKGKIGFINALSHNFCGGCNRVRLTSEGFLKPCLYHSGGVDLRALLRSGATEQELAAAFEQALKIKPERHGFESGLNPEKRPMSRIGG